MSVSNTLVLVDCRCCKRLFHIVAKTDDIISWRNGELIQNALSYLKPYERELLISETCDGCFKSMFPEEEEDEVVNVESYSSDSVHSDHSFDH